ncbi:transmembrane protein 272-like [Clinocottus analis]|uniref:transmembrane protein 272-like n=1 Tax=Clinocottus analis TaxID=304258 RepID=UPI0035C092C2
MSGSDGRIFRPTKPPAATLECSQVITSIIHLVIGAVYLNECPRQPYIPIYLLVLGVVCLLMTVFVLPCCDRPEIYSKIWICFVYFFVFCWFIAGNVWIYSIYEPNYNKTGSSMDSYCNKTLYMFAFWSTNLAYILLGFTMFISCCTYCCTYFLLDGQET